MKINNGVKHFLSNSMKDKHKCALDLFIFLLFLVLGF